MYNPILFSRKTRLRKSRHCGQVKCESQSCLIKSRVVRGSVFISPAQTSLYVCHSCWIVARLPISREVKLLGVTLDSQLRFDSHARAVAMACTYHKHALRHVRHLLTPELTTTIACSIVATRINYCNSLLYGAPAVTFDALRRVKNILARRLS